MFTVFDLEAFWVRYNAQRGEELTLIEFQDGNRVTFLNSSGEKLQLLPMPIRFTQELFFEDSRIGRIFPKDGRISWDRDMFKLSAILFARIRDLEKQFTATGPGPNESILLLTVTRWAYGGIFGLIPEVFAQLKTPFREVWVWTADGKDEFRPQIPFINCLKSADTQP